MRSCRARISELALYVVLASQQLGEALGARLTKHAYVVLCVATPRRDMTSSRPRMWSLAATADRHKAIKRATRKRSA